MHGYNFTEEVRRVLATARDEAHRLRHEYVGTEHILLGIVRCELCIATDVLRKLSVDFEAVRSIMFEIARPGATDRAASADLPYTSRAKKLLELAMVEARELGHAYVGSEHLLLGVMREERGIAAQTLSQLGLRIGDVRSEVLRHPGVPAVPSPPPPRPNVVPYDGSPGIVERVVTPKRGTWQAMYGALAAGVVVLGVLHVVSTVRLFPDASPAAMSHLGVGLLLILTGVLNMHVLQLGTTARSLRRTTVVANVVLTAFALAAGVVAGSHWAALTVVAGLIAAMTVLSATFPPGSS